MNDELIVSGCVWLRATAAERRWYRRHAPAWLRRIAGIWYVLA